MGGTKGGGGRVGSQFFAHTSDCIISSSIRPNPAFCFKSKMTRTHRNQY